MNLTEEELRLIAKLSEFGLTGIQILNYNEEDNKALLTLIQKIKERQDGNTRRTI